jgi:hypothetical protein
MPLPGERLVVFLSDGAFEEQRGGDWAPRWWRAEDSGLVAPIMIANGRRIDQRTTMAQQGGVDWLLRQNRATWAHCVEAVAAVAGLPLGDLLTGDEIAALEHRAVPEGILAQ